MSSDLEKTLFNMKMTAKMLEREVKKKEKEQREFDQKATKESGKSIEKQRMYVAEAIRCKKTALQFTRMALRMEAVASRV